MFGFLDSLVLISLAGRLSLVWDFFEFGFVGLGAVCTACFDVRVCFEFWVFVASSIDAASIWAFDMVFCMALHDMLTCQLLQVLQFDISISLQLGARSCRLFSVWFGFPACHCKGS